MVQVVGQQAGAVASGGGVDGVQARAALPSRYSTFQAVPQTSHRTQDPERGPSEVSVTVLHEAPGQTVHLTHGDLG